MHFWEELTGYLSFSFVQYALIAGVLIALCSSLLGVTLVLKRFSVIGDGLSHVAFGALAIATVLHLSNSMILVMPVTVVCAVLLLCASQSAKIKGDAAIAMLSVSALAIGYLVQNIFSSSANIAGDVCSTLFGSTLILTLSKLDVWICVIMSVVVIGIFLLFYHKIFAVTFDETFAAATGIRARLYNFLIAVVTAVIIVLAMNLVGSLLTSALIVFPALSVLQLSGRDFLRCRDLCGMRRGWSADLNSGIHASGRYNCYCRSGGLSGVLRCRGFDAPPCGINIFTVYSF